MITKLEKLEKQNKELLEILKHILFIFDKNYDKGTIGYNVCEEAKQAIAKAKE